MKARDAAYIVHEYTFILIRYLYNSEACREVLHDRNVVHVIIKHRNVVVDVLYLDLDPGDSIAEGIIHLSSLELTNKI